MAAQLYIKKLSKRDFAAACYFRNQWVTANGKKQRRSAIAALQEVLVSMGAKLPSSWEVIEVVPAPALDTNPAEEPEPKTQRIPTTPFLAEDQVAPPTNVAITEFPQAPKMDNGLVTPLSDRKTWVDTANRSIKTTLSLDLPADPKEATTVFRTNVNELMAAVGCVGAYKQLPNGHYWIRYTPEVTDYSVRAPKAGEGNRRVSRDINGNAVNSKGESLQLKARGGKKGSDKYEYPGTAEQKKVAYSAAKALSTRAKEEGRDAADQRLWYKYGYCVSLRSQGAVPHTKFEADLAAAQISEATLVQAAAEYKAA